MVHPDRATTPRSGNWSLQGDAVALRTHLASTTQIWNRQIPSRAAQKLVAGPYDLSMAWNLRLRDGKLTGTLRAGTPKLSPSGGIESFRPYNDPGVDPITVTFVPVPKRAPAVLVPTLEKVRATERGQAGSALKDWANEFYREGDFFGDKRGK